jgi:sugar phosphate isomerase/epimerase
LGTILINIVASESQIFSNGICIVGVSLVLEKETGFGSPKRGSEFRQSSMMIVGIGFLCKTYNAYFTGRMDMKHFVFAMDTCFRNSIVGVYPYEIRCEILAELGFDGIYVSLSPEDLRNAPKMAMTKQQYGLHVTAAYGGIDIALPEGDPKLKLIAELFQQLPTGCDLELSLSCGDSAIERSSPEADSLAMAKLESLLQIAERQNAHICLYPHFGAWLERVEDGVRLCRKVSHPCLRVVFCGFHWYAADGKGLEQRIQQAIPYLHSVNMCGSRKGGNIAGCTIEPLDCGEMDNFALLALLNRDGYTGRIGFQGYGIGGDVYNHLQCSLVAFRNMEARLAKHPNWIELATGVVAPQ